MSTDIIRASGRGLEALGADAGLVERALRRAGRSSGSLGSGGSRETSTEPSTAFGNDPFDRSDLHSSGRRHAGVTTRRRELLAASNLDRGGSIDGCDRCRLVIGSRKRLTDFEREDTTVARLDETQRVTA